MSKSYWNCLGDLNLLKALGMCIYLSLVHLSRKRSRVQHDQSEDFDSDSDDYLPSTVEAAAPLLQTFGTLLQYAEVHKVLEYTRTQFEQMKTLADFKKSQCLFYFRLKKK